MKHCTMLTLEPECECIEGWGGGIISKAPYRQFQALNFSRDDIIVDISHAKEPSLCAYFGNLLVEGD